MRYRVALTVGAGLVCVATGGWLGAQRPGSLPAGLPTPSAAPTASVQATSSAAQTMPDVRGLSERDARQAIADSGITATVKVVKQPHVTATGFVVAQEPIGGQPAGDTITLTLPSAATMPKLAGATEDAARTQLEAMGATVEVTRRYDAKATPGTVLSSTPAAGAALAERVQLVLAAPGGQLSLGKVEREGDCGSGEAAANGEAFADAVTCRVHSEARTTLWLLGRKTQSLAFTLGMDDHGDPTSAAQVTVTGDGKPLLSQKVVYGASKAFTVPTAGVLRLEVTVVRTDKGTADGFVVLGTPVLTGGSDELAGLER